MQTSRTDYEAKIKIDARKIVSYLIVDTHLMTEHGCPSSKLNRLSNEGGGRSLSFYRPQRRSLAGLGDRGKTGWLYTILDGELRPFPTMSAFGELGCHIYADTRFRKFAIKFFLPAGVLLQGCR